MRMTGMRSIPLRKATAYPANEVDQGNVSPFPVGKISILKDHRTLRS
jgi:hypothetical protein